MKEMDLISTTRKVWENAYRLKNGEHPILYENERIMESTKEVAAKYEKILHIRKEIKRKEKEAFKDTTPQTNTNQRRALKDITSENNMKRREVAKDTRSQDYISHHSSQDPNHTTTNHNDDNNQMQDVNIFNGNIMPVNQVENTQQNDDNHQMQHVNIINENIVSVNQVENTQHNQNVHDTNVDEENVVQEHCDNCQRKQCHGTQDPYIIQLQIAHSSDIRRKGAFKHVKAYTGLQARDYMLCRECFEYCVEKRDPTKCAWPAFLWNLLSGHHQGTFDTWKLLIEDMRSRSIDNSYAWINAGARIVETYNNRDDIDERIIFARCISPREVESV